MPKGRFPIRRRTRGWDGPSRLAAAFLALALAPLGVASAQPAPSPETLASAKTWLENRLALEDYLRTAEVEQMAAIPVGVTKPMRARLAAGGPVAEIAWKPLPPGRYGGFWESYKSEIAAYELDKLLGLDMVPPTVEKRVKGTLGAAVMWVSPTKSFKDLGGAPRPPAAYTAAWNRQIVRAKMFDNLIANIDPNLGNWLVDPAWNVILIDHTRAFTGTKNMVHELTRVDGALWDRMRQLDQAALDQALGSLVGKGELRAVVERRDRMAAAVDALVAKHGEAAIIVR